MGTASTRVAIVGAGIAGAACAHGLAAAGLAVQVFDKSRGVGGRMATRRAEWTADGVAHRSGFDHGAPGFTARSPGFLHFVEQAQRDGRVARWRPALAPESLAVADDAELWVPTPDMPALCRTLLAGVPLQTGCAVDALRHGPRGWCLESGGSTVGEVFDAVILAVPAPQAAPLLRPHRAGVPQNAPGPSMRPGWTLMGVTDEVAPSPSWDLARPQAGPLACVLRNDRKPGRAPVPGLAQWVVHATTDWSRQHLEAPPAEVQARLQDALAQEVGRPLRWHHGAVHRWRYATAPLAGEPVAGCLWDADAGLGVIGDAMGGGGVEGAWLSAQALLEAMSRWNRAAPAVGPTEIHREA